MRKGVIVRWLDERMWAIGGHTILSWEKIEQKTSQNSSGSSQTTLNDHCKEGEYFLEHSPSSFVSERLIDCKKQNMLRQKLL
jgi:hypothetical protein